MIPTLVDEPPTTEGWIHEVKHDGHRTILAVDGAMMAHSGCENKTRTKLISPHLSTGCRQEAPAFGRLSPER
jgi:hypothetical protein